MKKILSAILFFALTAITVSAASLDDLSLKTRFGYNQSFEGKERLPEAAGFFADYAILGVEATLFDGLTFKYEHNLSEIYYGFWNTIDDLTLNYDLNNWSFSAGKMFSLVGTWEFDSDDIEIYHGSEFWQQSEVYQLGALVAYNFNNETDQINFQVTSSPFRFLTSDNRDLMQYNIMWYGEHDWFQTAYSANFVGYEKGKFMNYIALGNRFEFENGYLDLDFINRADMESYKFFKDFTAVADFRLRFGENDRVELGLKYSFDYNDGNQVDYMVLDGTKLHTVSARVDFRPIKNYSDLRLFCFVSDSFGEQTNESYAVNIPKCLSANIGINWNVDFLKIFSKN